MLSIKELKGRQAKEGGTNEWSSSRECQNEGGEEPRLTETEPGKEVR